MASRAAVRTWGPVTALVVIVTTLAVLLSPPPERSASDPRPSSYLLSPRGTAALFHTLEELGVPARRRLTPWAEADSLRAGLLLVLAPADPPSPAELGALGRWLDSGGTLVYAAAPDDATLDSLGLVLAPRDSVPRFGEPRDSTAVPAAARHPLLAGVDTVHGFGSVFADTSRALRERRAVPLLRTSGGRAVAVLIPRGRGRVLALSDPASLGNAALRRSGIALPLARLAREGGGPAWFDEYHHGFRGGGSPGRALRRVLFGTPAGWAVLQLAVAALGLLYLRARRFGAPLPDPAARRRSPLEHVEALAGAYRQAGARRVARRLLAAGLARRLGRRPPRDEREAERAIDEITSRRAGAPRAARELRDEWSRGDAADLVALSRGVDRLLEEVRRP